MPRCSKAPRGLFVQVCVTRVFTGISVSPGPSLRQRLSRYTFRAGRNLPDKEFRLSRCSAIAEWRLRLPAYRYAARTISSPDVSGVRRMVSEDSDHFVSGFLAIHGLHD